MNKFEIGDIVVSSIGRKHNWHYKIESFNKNGNAVLSAAPTHKDVIQGSIKVGHIYPGVYNLYDYTLISRPRITSSLILET